MTDQENKYYVVSFGFIEPVSDCFDDSDTIEIWNEPMYIHRGPETRIEGSCIGTGGFTRNAHGEYETLEEARAAVEQDVGPVRKVEICHEDDEDKHEREFWGSQIEGNHVVEVYKTGKYKTATSEFVESWCYEFMREEITANTTDDRLDELADEIEEEANNEGTDLGAGRELFTVKPHITEILERWRRELKDE